MDSNNLDLYYFNNKITSPIIFLITRVFSVKDEKFIEENVDYIFKSLIDSSLADESNILVLNIIKEYNSKIINWIVPSKKSDNNIVKQIENNNIINQIIIETIKNINCETYLTFTNEELKIQDCKFNLDFLIEQYYN
jgi:hypothetical protein